jgi:hypothetical protein
MVEGSAVGALFGWGPISVSPRPEITNPDGSIRQSLECQPFSCDGSLYRYTPINTGKTCAQRNLATPRPRACPNLIRLLASLR